MQTKNIYISFKVPSEMYGTTDAVISNIDHAIKTGFCPCGSGEDYKLNANEIEQLKQIANGEDIEFKPQTKKFHASFRGRLRGAIGSFYQTSTDVEGINEYEARINLYKTHEHISGLTLKEIK
jgi:hypothetical protein